MRKSYYLTLGIPRNESTEGIRQAFREIVKRYHPDRVGFERLRFFQEIVEAYHVLADPERAEIMTGDSTMRTPEPRRAIHLFQWASPAEKICLNLYRFCVVFL